MHIGRLSSSEPPYRDIGWTSETEAAVWLFTPDRKRSRPVWFTPYAFVDLPLGLIHGREIYGADRDFGWFGFPHHPVFPTGAHEPDQVVLDAFGVPKFGSEHEWRRYRLLSISRAAQKTRLDSQWRAMAECSRAFVAQLIAAWPDGLSRLGSDLNSLWHPHGTVVFLKQLYDAADSGRASYQALVEVPVGVPLEGFRGGGLLSGRYELDLRDSDTHPIARDVGLSVGRQPALFAFWLDCDLDLGRGQEVWRASNAAERSSDAVEPLSAAPTTGILTSALRVATGFLPQPLRTVARAVFSSDQVARPTTNRGPRPAPSPRLTPAAPSASPGAAPARARARRAQRKRLPR